MKKCCIRAFLLLLLTACSVTPTDNSNRIASGFLVSHKTAGLEYPENSLDGFENSLAMRDVQAIEIDLHLTKDKKLVLHHDPVLSSYNCFDKGSERRVVIAQSSLQSLMALDCMNHKVGKRYQLPSLDQVLRVYRASASEQQLLIEVKVWDELIHNNPLHSGLDSSAMHHPDGEVVERLYAKLREHGIRDKVMFNTFSRSMLLALKAEQSDTENFQYGLLYKGSYAPRLLGLIALLTPMQCYDSCWAPDYREVAQWLSENDIEFFIPNYPQLTSVLFRRNYQRDIERKAHPFKVIPWTLNSEAQWENSRRYRFSGIITDKPSEFRKSYPKQAERNPNL